MTELGGDGHTNETRELNDACVEWDGPDNGRGYGSKWRRFGPGDTEVLAHRIAYRLERGDIPEGMTIDHLCRNKLCLNVAHMEVVTRGENSLRAGGIEACAAKKRAITHCPSGHLYDEANTYTDRVGRRSCRLCRKVRSAEHYQRSKENSNG